MRDDVFKQITDRIAAQLEQGVRPWSQPWTNSAAAADLPSNLISGKPYRGANVFWLWIVGQSNGYASPLWLTFKQAKAKGGNVRKGEKGTPVFFWKPGERIDAKTGETVKTFMVREYMVWNVAQCDGIEVPTIEAPKTEAERLEAAESMIRKTGAVIQHGGNRACYIPSIDVVKLPAFAQFKSADGYYSTAFHELGHWTGHTSRLAREYGKRFGDEAYAFEELVAELTAAFVCGSQGFANVEREDHAPYLANWLKVLKGDPKAFIKAAGDAQKAADLVMGKPAAYAKAEPLAEAA